MLNEVGRGSIGWYHCRRVGSQLDWAPEGGGPIVCVLAGGIMSCPLQVEEGEMQAGQEAMLDLGLEEASSS